MFRLRTIPLHWVCSSKLKTTCVCLVSHDQEIWLQVKGVLGQESGSALGGGDERAPCGCMTDTTHPCLRFISGSPSESS